MRDLRFTREQIVVAAIIVLGLLFVGSRLLNRSHAVAAPPIPTAASTHAAAKTGGAERMYVDVVGAVRRPGLYRLPRGSRIADAVARAGGATRNAQLELVNVAAPIADGEQVVVPVRGAAAVSSAGGSAAGEPAAGGPVDLNSASAEQLDGLPGIGPATAAKILAYREQHGAFHSLAELDAVPGIGAGRIAELKGLVVPP